MKPLKDRVAEAAAAAKKVGCLPPALLVAQWALESGWGRYAPGNNCFGIKARPGEPRQLLTTHEWFTAAQLATFLVKGDGRSATPTGKAQGSLKQYLVKDWFVKFDSLEACFARRCGLASSGRYAPLLAQFQQDGDLEKFVRGFAPIYATDPGYASTLMKLINSKVVQEALTV